MQRTTHARNLVLFALVLAMIVTAPIGQAKPPPPTADGSVPPPTHTGRKPKPQPVDTAPNGPDVAGFANAYERSNEPSMLVLVGRDTRTYEKLSGAATGNRSAVSDKVIGGELNLVDSEGNAQKLHGDIEQILLESPADVDLLSVAALTEADRRDVRLLKTQGDLGAVDLLASKVNAEVVLLVRLIDSASVRAKGARYRVVVETLDVTRGRKIGGFTFDWMQGTDSRTVKAYATAITRKFMEQYIIAKSRGGADGAPRKYTVRFIGLKDTDQLRSARDVFESVKGVSKVRSRGMSKTEETSVGNLEVTFAGDPLDLVYDAKRAIKAKLGMSPDASDVQAGTITFKVGDEEVAFVPPYHLKVYGIGCTRDAKKILTRLQAIAGASDIKVHGVKTIPETGDEIGEWSLQYEGQSVNLAQMTAALVSEVIEEPVTTDVQIDPSLQANLIVLKPGTPDVP